jgi:hypothetical protein
MGDQRELFGLVASVPTVWRTLVWSGAERFHVIALQLPRADRGVTAAAYSPSRSEGLIEYSWLA